MAYQSISDTRTAIHPSNVVDSTNISSAVAEAERIAIRRLAHYQAQIKAYCENPIPGFSNFYSEETVSLRDGGVIRSVSTSDGRVYYLKKADKWLFLERSASDAVQTLYIYEKDEMGRDKLTQKVNTR